MSEEKKSGVPEADLQELLGDLKAILNHGGCEMNADERSGAFWVINALEEVVKNKTRETWFSDK